MVDVVRPGRAPGRGDALAGLRRHEREIADLGTAVRMRPDPAAEMQGQHLRPEAEAEIGPVLLEGHTDPVDLPFHEIVRVVGAHRAAEDHGAGVVRHRLRQRIAVARPADVEAMPALGDEAPDAARRRVFLVQDDEDRVLGALSHGRHAPAQVAEGLLADRRDHGVVEAEETADAPDQVGLDFVTTPSTAATR